MTELVIAVESPFSLLTHMSFYGVAAIAESQGLSPRLCWIGGMDQRPSIVDVDEIDIAKAILDSASRHSDQDQETWLTKRFVISGQEVGLFSPRIRKISEREDWKKYAKSRHEAIDNLTNDWLTNKRDWVTLRFIWSLGEACYWLQSSRSSQDEAASRLEMQPRNGGADLITARLWPLSKHVAERSEDEILDALKGKIVNDEVGENKPNSLSAVGFRGSGPVDDTVSWCALWGISQFALTQLAHKPAITAGFLNSDSGSGGMFYVPVWKGLWTPARLRSILCSGQLRAFVAAAVAGASERTSEVARKWLASRGVQAVFTFEENKKVGVKCEQRMAQRGVLHHVV